MTQPLADLVAIAPRIAVRYLRAAVRSWRWKRRSSPTACRFLKTSRRRSRSRRSCGGRRGAGHDCNQRRKDSRWTRARRHSRACRPARRAQSQPRRSAVYRGNRCSRRDDRGRNDDLRGAGRDQRLRDRRNRRAHRGAETTLDISADLDELARTPVAVVCAGAKALLDLPKTLEVLETRGVPVICYRSDEFPAFWSRSSGLRAPLRLDSAAEIARAIRSQRSLGYNSGTLIANPVDAATRSPRTKSVAHIGGGGRSRECRAHLG